MAAAETARLIASLELQDKNFTRGIKNVERGVGRVDRKLSAFGGFVNRNLARGIDRAAASLVDGVFAGVESLVELEQQQAQTNAVIKSTGQIAGVTGDDVTRLAEKYESLNAIIGDEVVRSGENMLLTFTNIGKDAFEPTLQAVLDMNTALGKGPEGLTSTAMQVGKALNDPTKGLTKLQRAGVTFTKAQVKKIKSLQKEGKLYEAQQVILKELNREFGGSFAAQGDTTAGKVAKFHDAVEDLQRTFAKALLPIIVKVADKLGTFLADPAVVKGIEQAGEALGAAFDGVLEAAEKINWAAIGNGLRIAADFAGQLVGWFGRIPDWAQALLVGGLVATRLPVIGGLISELGKGLIKGVLGITAGVVNVNGPVAGGAGGAGGAAGGASKLMKAVRILGAVSIAGASLIALAEVFRGFQETVTESQQDLLEKVNQTSEQGFTETINNLKATNKGIQNMNPLENVLAGIFGGSEIVKNFQMATSRIDAAFKAGELSRDEMITAIGALEETLRLNPEIELPGTESLLKQLITAVNNGPKNPEKPEVRPRVNGVGDRPSPGNPGEFRKNLDKIGFEKWVAKAGEIKTAITTESSAQKAELGLIKNASATLNTTTNTAASRIVEAINGIATSSGRGQADPKDTSLANKPLFNPTVRLDTSQVQDLRQSLDQKDELARIKNASATLNTTTSTGLGTVSTGIQTAAASAGTSASNIANTARSGLSNTTGAARQAGFTASAAMANAATRIVGAVNALDLSVNVTTVNRTSTVNNRYGPSGGSSTTQRAGGNTG